MTSRVSGTPGRLCDVALEVFSPAVRDWFRTSFEAPTRAQRKPAATKPAANPSTPSASVAEQSAGEPTTQG